MMDTSSKNSSTHYIQTLFVTNFVSSIRRRKGWSQTKLAKKMGCTQAYVSFLEKQTDWKKVPLRFYEKLSKVAECKMEPPQILLNN